jgi:hypothetical protein
MWADNRQHNYPVATKNATRICQFVTRLAEAKKNLGSHFACIIKFFEAAAMTTIIEKTGASFHRTWER